MAAWWPALRISGRGPAAVWIFYPGDTVVVPLDTERVPALPTWQSITTILYNVAIAVAAIHSF